MLNALLLASILAVTIPPATPEFISDQADLLTPAQEQELQKVFEDVYVRQNTRLGLLTLSELDDDPKATSVRTINYWKMTPDSVLVMVSMNPRKIFLQPGSNLQYRFDESTSVGIIRDSMAPNLKQGRYAAGILNGFHAISNRLPGQATPPPNTVVFTEPVKVTLTPQPVAAAPDSGTTTGHPFLIFLGVSGLLIGAYFLVRYVLRKDRETKEAQARDEATYQRLLEVSRKENERRLKGTQAPPARTAPREAYRTPAPQPAPTPASTQVIHVDSSGSDLTNAVLLNHMLTQPTPAPRQEYAPPPPRPSPPRYTPPPSPPRRSSWSSDDSSSGGGGGGFDFGGGDSGGSDGGGGGGGDF